MTNNQFAFPESTRDRILLAGAGFSASVGGFLATQMWEKFLLSEEVFADPQLRRIVKDPSHNFDYEKIFHHILNHPEINAEAKTATQKALNQVYIEHNRHVQDDSIIKKINYKWLRSFLRSFCSEKDKRGFIFTTNQDLFFENLTRSLDRHNGLDSYIPYETRPQNRISTSCFLKAIGLPKYCYEENKATLPNADELPGFLQQSWNQGDVLHFVKMHGSWGWTAADSQQQMIVGVNKESLIEKVPLLKYYYNLFDKVLSQFKGKLLVIGYSFSDPHINRVIIKGLANGLALHVIDKRRPRDFYDSLKNEWYPIWDGLQGYYPYGVEEIFAAGNAEISAKDKIIPLKRHFDFDQNHF